MRHNALMLDDAWGDLQHQLGEEDPQKGYLMELSAEQAQLLRHATGTLTEVREQVEDIEDSIEPYLGRDLRTAP